MDKVPRMTRQDNKNFIKTTCSGDHFHKDESAWSKQKPELITSAQLDNDMYRFASLQNDIEVLTRKTSEFGLPCQSSRYLTYIYRLLQYDL